MRPRLTRQNRADILRFLRAHDKIWSAIGVTRGAGLQYCRAVLKLDIGGDCFKRLCLYARTRGDIDWRGRSHKHRGRDLKGQMLLPLENVA